MTKNEFIDSVAERSGLSKAKTKEVIDAAVDVIKDAVKADDKIQLVGFGAFELGKRAAREGRNPQTGETKHIPAKNVPKFKPGKTFKDYVNE